MDLTPEARSPQIPASEYGIQRLWYQASPPQLLLTVKPEAAVVLVVQRRRHGPFSNEYQPARNENAIVAKHITARRHQKDLSSI